MTAPLRFICLLATLALVPLASASTVEDATANPPLAATSPLPCSDMTPEACVHAPADACADSTLGQVCARELSNKIISSQLYLCQHYEGDPDRDAQSDHTHNDCVLQDTGAGHGINCSQDQWSWGPDSGHGAEPAYSNQQECTASIGNAHGLFICVGYYHAYYNYTTSTGSAWTWDVQGCSVGIKP